VSLYEKVVKLNPRKAAIHTRLGFAYAELKKPAQSAENYEKAIRYGAKDPQIRQNLALIYGRTGKTKESIAMYERLAAANPTTEVLNILADAYMKEKQYENAIRIYKKLIDQNPKKAAGYASVAYAYGLKGDLDRQIEYYLMSLKLDSEDDEVYANLGAAYEKKGLFQEALRAYTTAYELNPDSTMAARRIPQIRIRIMQQKP
jgi:pentatricopeptide repeat protein